MTAAGLVAIETVKEGDYVLSTNSETMETAYKPVLETYVRETDKLVHLTIHGEEIITTYDHPFYVLGQGFVNAINLCIGMELVDAGSGILRVEQIYREDLCDETRTVYNFQVEEFHTYHVGTLGVLVHNADYKKPKSGSGKEKATDIPSRFKGERPFVNESGKDFAKRLCDEAYGKGNYDTGPKSDYNKLKKYGDKAFINP